MKGKSHLIRYADDFVILFMGEDDARRVMEVLPERFEKYGLTLHPEKTRLVPFRRPPHGRPAKGPTGATGRKRSTSWVSPMIGVLPAWILGGDAADGVEAFELVGAWHRPMVPEESAPSGARAARAAESKGAWTLRVLRDYQQRACVADIPASSACGWRKWLDRRNRQCELTWDRFRRLLARCPPRRRGLSTRCTSGSESMTRGTVCFNVCTYGFVGALGGQPPRATRPLLAASAARSAATQVSPRPPPLVECLRVFAVQREHRFERGGRNLPRRLLLGVGIAMRGQQAIEELEQVPGTRSDPKASIRRRCSTPLEQVEQLRRSPLGCAGGEPGAGQVVERLAGPTERANQVLLVEPGAVAGSRGSRGPPIAPARSAAAVSGPGPWCLRNLLSNTGQTSARINSTDPLIR